MQEVSRFILKKLEGRRTKGIPALSFDEDAERCAKRLKDRQDNHVPLAM